MSRAKRSGWKRTVLLVAAGCLAVAVATVVVGVGALLWARSVAEGLGDPTPVPVTRTVTLPPERLPVIRAGMTSASEGHRLEVELQDGRFEVVAGEPGGTIEINGEIAGNYYELVEERAGTDGGGPVTAIRLRPTTNSLVRMMASLGGSGPSAQVNRLTVTIPPDRQIALVLRVARGVGERTGAHAERVESYGQLYGRSERRLARGGRVRGHSGARDGGAPASHPDLGAALARVARLDEIWRNRSDRQAWRDRRHPDAGGEARRVDADGGDPHQSHRHVRIGRARGGDIWPPHHCARALRRPAHRRPASSSPL